MYRLVTKHLLQLQLLGALFHQKCGNRIRVRVVDGFLVRFRVTCSIRVRFSIWPFTWFTVEVGNLVSAGNSARSNCLRSIIHGLKDVMTQVQFIGSLTQVFKGGLHDYSTNL